MSGLWPYNVESLEAAKRIILTGPTETRWKEETAFLVDLIGDPGKLVLDFGCGVGRLARPLIERWPEVQVVGVDQSESMRKLAEDYVRSPRFSVMPELPREGQHDIVLAVWVLSHTPTLADDLDAIAGLLASTGSLFVATVPNRHVPVGDKNWRDDGLNIEAELDQRFRRVSGGRSKAPGDTAWWGKYALKVQ